MRHHYGIVQIDLGALPNDPVTLQRMLQEIVPELQAENEKLWQLIQRLLRHRYGPRSERLDLGQLQLVLEDAEQSAAEGDAAKKAARPRRDAAIGWQRTAIVGRLPRYEVVIDIESTLWLPRLRGCRGAGARAGAADRWRDGNGSVGGPRRGQQIL